MRLAEICVTPRYTVPLTVEFVKAHHYLTVDTRHFDRSFVEILIGSLATEDGGLIFDGLCIMGENFHALSLLQRRYLGQLTSIYIDPPYNTDATPIVYKNGYRHSSWLSLIDNRLELAMPLLSESGILCVTIDDVEVHALRLLMDASLPQYEVFGVAPIKNNPAGRTERLVSPFAMSTRSFMACLIRRALDGWSTAKPRRHATRKVMTSVHSSGPTSESMGA